MSNKTHFRLSPSGSACWTKCLAAPGYVASLNLPPDRGSVYAEEGERAHDYAEKILRHRLLDGPKFTLEDIPADAWPPHLQDEYLQCVEDYVARCLEVAATPGRVFIEESVHLFYAPLDPTAKGTCDFCHITDSAITIRDLKAGAGVPVDAVENTQMAIYAASFVYQYGYECGPVDDSFVVIMEIDQPRGFSGNGAVSRWETTFGELRGFCEHINQAVDQINSGEENLPFFPSEKTCRWCRAKAVCSARNEALDCIPVEVLPPPTLDGLEAITDELPSVRTVSVDKLLELWKNSKVIRQILDDTEDYLTELANSNADPRLKIVEGGLGHRKWIDERKVDRLLARHGVKEKERNKFKLQTPAQVFKLPAVKGDEKLQVKLEKHITRPPGAPKLALVEDQRPALDRTAGLTPILEWEDVI